MRAVSPWGSSSASFSKSVFSAFPWLINLYVYIIKPNASIWRGRKWKADRFASSHKSVIDSKSAYLSTIPHMSICRSLKFPNNICCTLIRSTKPVSVRMRRMHPWKTLNGFLQTVPSSVFGHPADKNTPFFTWCQIYTK